MADAGFTSNSGRNQPLGLPALSVQISPTFAGEVSVTARFDCPPFAKTPAPAHRRCLPELRRFASQMRFPDFFDQTTCCFLERDQIQAVCEFISTMIGGFARDEQRALFIVSLANLLEMTSRAEIDRPNLAQDFSPI
jgi:hypothetical protein